MSAPAPKLTVVFRSQRLGVSLSAKSIKASTGTPIARELVERPAYTGPTEITPSAETQTLETKDLRMTEDITIQPIPSNYGLITWDGTTITVS